MSMSDADPLTISDHMRSIIFPDKNMSVSSLLLFHLPSSTVTDPPPLHQYFSSDHPHHESSHPSYLRTYTIPTPGALRRLLDEAASNRYSSKDGDSLSSELYRFDATHSGILITIRHSGINLSSSEKPSKMGFQKGYTSSLSGCICWAPQFWASREAHYRLQSFTQ